ncbi:hypothetical protein [Staphylococcus phage ZCSS1]|uniref:Uncharacterized protein n=1 Tax=Staphylococcus phage UHP46 TaxID=3234966 RepID=A0AB39C7W0_9CAUD|nr:hypothetical protein [Staphylococcus phage ZCSS1]
MRMIQLLEGITSRIGINEFGVSKIVLLDNMIVIEGVISIADVSKNERLDYDYRVTTRDSVETFVNSRLVTDTVIKELKSIENFKSGTTVEKDGKKFMLVPAEGSIDTFYRLDLATLEVDTERMDNVELYKEEYIIVE